MSDKNKGNGAPKVAATVSKFVTPESRLANMVKAIHPIHAALLIERIQHAVKDAADAVRTGGDAAKAYANPIIPPAEYVRLEAFVNQHLQSNDTV